MDKEFNNNQINIIKLSKNRREQLKKSRTFFSELGKLEIKHEVNIIIET